MWWRLGGWCVSAPALLLGTEIREIGGGGVEAVGDAGAKRHRPRCGGPQRNARGCRCGDRSLTWTRLSQLQRVGALPPDLAAAKGRRGVAGAQHG